MGRTPFVLNAISISLKMCIFAVGIKDMRAHGGNSLRIIKNDTRLVCLSEVSHPSQENESDAKRENQEDDFRLRLDQVGTIDICCRERKS